MDVQSYPWHSPRYVLEAYDGLLKEFGGVVSTAREFKTAREARISAIALLGIYKLQNRHYLMQVYREGASPDIVTLTLTERGTQPVLANLQDVEVVIWEKHSKEKDLLDFLLTTKLSLKKSYDEKTIILCEIKKTMLLPSYNTIHTKLKTVNPKPTVIVIGKVSPNKHIYQICQVWPEIDFLTEIDVLQIASSYPPPHNLMLQLGSEKKITFKKGTLSKPSYFDVFGLSESDLKQHFKQKGGKKYE